MDKIPSFACKEDCHGCCGLVPFNTKERDAIAKVRPMELWEPFVDGAWVPTAALATFSCPFLTKDGCGIYEIRPIVCRLFGAVDHPMMKCPEGCGPAKLIPEHKSRRLIARAAA